MSGIVSHRSLWAGCLVLALGAPAAVLAQGVEQQTTPGAATEVVTVGTPPIEGGYLYIAGVKPSERPAGAPVITEFVKTPEWYAQALSGVSEPYPASLNFLEDVGGWWTPFAHPGMPGHYDIRGWHAAK